MRTAEETAILDQATSAAYDAMEPRNRELAERIARRIFDWIATNPNFGPLPLLGNAKVWKHVISGNLSEVSKDFTITVEVK